MDRGQSTSLSTVSTDNLGSLSLEDWGKLTDAFIILVNVKGVIVQTSHNSLAYLGIESEHLCGSLFQDQEFGVGTDSNPRQTQTLLEKIESEQFADAYLLSLSDCDGNECKLTFQGRLLETQSDEVKQLLLVGRSVQSKACSSGNSTSKLTMRKLHVLHEVADQSAHQFNNLLTAFSFQICNVEEMASNNDQLQNIQQELAKIFGHLKKQSHDLSRACAEIKPSSFLGTNLGQENNPR